MINEEDVRRIDMARRDAMIQGDVDQLSAMLADDVLWIHATARVDTKAGFLDSIASGKTRYLGIETSDETLRLIGDLAVISGVAATRALIAGEEKELESRFTAIWRSSHGSWQIVHWQSTAVATAP